MSAEKAEFITLPSTKKYSCLKPILEEFPKHNRSNNKSIDARNRSMQVCELNTQIMALQQISSK